jgi:hypothetical protein
MNFSDNGQRVNIEVGKFSKGRMKAPLEGRVLSGLPEK